MPVMVSCHYCGECEERNPDKITQHTNKRYYHLENCYDEYLKNVEYMKTWKQKYNLLIDKILDIYSIENETMLPRVFHTDLHCTINGITRVNGKIIGGYHKPVDCCKIIDMLIKGYENGEEVISESKKNKEFKDLLCELQYGLSIAKSKVRVTKDSEAPKIDIVLNEVQDHMLQQFIIESPIEETLLMYLIYYKNEKVNLITQKEYEINGRRYRVDIIIEQEHENNTKRFIIECDGHDFHEKAKEAVMRDNQRDRDFLSIGIPTLRFSGTEIHNNPKQCSDEILRLIS